DGKGNFSLAPGALPANFVSKACVRAVDFDHDGDLDLFVSGRVQPGRYPSPVSSFIYRNDSRNGEPRFTDVTREVAPDLVNIGMVCDALWTDFDNDGWEDLLLAGEWMPIMFLKNNRGIFENVTDQSGVSKQKGWWNSIVAADVDNDGNMDYIVGNLGLNSFYRAGPSTPVRAYGKDFDANAVFDMIPSLYLPDREGMKKEFPAQGRDDLLKQVNAFRKKFPTYQSYAQATMDDLLTDDQRKDALVLEANYFASSLLRNEGNGRFSLLPLPVPAQISSVYGMVADDVDGDGNLDLILNGNDFGTEVFVGRYDALNGLYLQGDGKGGFTPKSIMESGIFIPGNGRALVKYCSASGKYMLVASQNRGALKFFELKKDLLLLRMQPSDRSALLTLKNGRTQKQEFYHGHSFLSQSGRWLSIGDQVISIEITGGDGKKRTGTFSK
ncbi:MAG TPA: VCBS repeat-containing protein, partial [Puia sp.]|nr:VCBS repeat-containing protein [Puia sp.]